MNMDISLIALIVSGISLCFSLYIARKQKGISAAANTYLDANELIGYRLGLYIVNSGMEPTTLRQVLIETYDGQTFRHTLHDAGENHVRLAQSEFYECFFGQANSKITEWAKHRIKSAKVVDSYGHGWQIKDFADAINQRHHGGVFTPSFLGGDLIGQVKAVLGRCESHKRQRA